MAEYSANALQTVDPGESVVFTASPNPCQMGLILHRDETGDFSLSGWAPNNSGCGCRCRNNDTVIYDACFGANIAVPTGETVGEISVAIAIGGTTIPYSEMIVTPAAVEEFFNVSRCIGVPIWKNCCQTVSVRNTSTIPILVQNANIKFTRPDL